MIRENLLNLELPTGTIPWLFRNESTAEANDAWQRACRKERGSMGNHEADSLPVEVMFEIKHGPDATR